jgi:hypothetical protein
VFPARYELNYSKLLTLSRPPAHWVCHSYFPVLILCRTRRPLIFSRLLRLILTKLCSRFMLTMHRVYPGIIHILSADKSSNMRPSSILAARVRNQDFFRFGIHILLTVENTIFLCISPCGLV